MFNSVTEDLALLKHTGCLQDAWNSVGCFGDDYHTTSEDAAGAWRPLTICAVDVSTVFPLTVHRFFIFSWFSRKIMKNNRNQ